MLDRKKRPTKLAQVAPQCSSSVRVNESDDMEIPDGNGLLLRLDSETGEAIMESVLDHHASAIHPNSYIPAAFSGLHVMKGGGSGAAVFAGSHPVLHDVVMKHAGAKDTREVLSLAEIGKEFRRRDPEAADYLRKRIPEFSFFYLSPYHVRDRSTELCSTVRVDTFKKIMLNHRDSATGNGADDSDSDGENDFSPQRRSNSNASLRKSFQTKRHLLVHRGEPIGIETFFSKVMVHIPDFTNHGRIRDGHEFLARFVGHLEAAQHDSFWKITVGQKQIGGRASENGAHILVAGQLKGALLVKTIEEYTSILRNLRALTLKGEKNVLKYVTDEVYRLSQTSNVKLISKTCDQFVGSSILKNFHPVKGRFVMLRQIGQCIRDGTLVLTENEAKAAGFLGRILRQGTSLSGIFTHSPQFSCALDEVENSWLDVLRIATSFENPAMTNRIWTCGLTDAGLHNAFVDLERGLELFDLGKPSLMPEPAFLTKFLMSLYVDVEDTSEFFSLAFISHADFFFRSFHAFGMEDDGKGSWVHRFEAVHQSNAPPKLKLTPDTERKISNANVCYQFAVQHFVNNLFHHNTQAAALLVRYTVLQLLSDAGFCLQRWQSKGGGNARFGYNARQDLSKWLWRSIWDLYIASEVCDRFSDGRLLKTSDSH